MKTIVGQRIALNRNELVERIKDIIPYTNEYFSSWHSHDTFEHNEEPYILPNAIYVYARGLLKVNVINRINITYDDRIPAVFFEQSDNFEHVNTSDERDKAIKISVNKQSVGYYLININTLVLSDCTHNSDAEHVFRSIWPELVRELGLLPIDTSKDIRFYDVHEITVGCDPEFEMIDLMDDNNIIDASDIIDGNTRTKIGVDGAGDQVEVRPDPGTPIKVTQNIRNLIKKFSEDYPDYDLTDRGDIHPLGGHIHIGIGMQYNAPDKLIELLDDFIGKPTIELSGEAREDYKELGQVRSQPHGFEYRTCPAAVFQNPAASCIVMKLAKNLVEKFVNAETMTYRNRPTIDDYIEVGGLSKQQATYFWNFCRVNFRPAKSIVAAWRIKKTLPTLYEPTIVFKDVWSEDAKAIIQRILSGQNIKFKREITIEYYGIKEKRGFNLCTIGTWSTSRLSPLKEPWPSANLVRIGVSYDRRTINCRESFVLDLIRATKNFINSKIND